MLLVTSETTCINDMLLHINFITYNRYWYNIGNLREGGGESRGAPPCITCNPCVISGAREPPTGGGHERAPGNMEQRSFCYHIYGNMEQRSFCYHIYSNSSHSHYCSSVANNRGQLLDSFH